MSVETFYPHPGDTDFQCLWRVETEIESRGFSIGFLERDEPRGIMPSGYIVNKWRNLSAAERKECVGVMKFEGRPRSPDRIIVEWKDGAK